jgi:hypothetical protein
MPALEAGVEQALDAEAEQAVEEAGVVEAGVEEAGAVEAGVVVNNMRFAIILFYQFITKKIIYNFSTICTVNVTNPPSLTAFKSELWREPLLRQCFSIGT